MEKTWTYRKFDEVQRVVLDEEGRLLAIVKSEELAKRIIKLPDLESLRENSQ